MPSHDKGGQGASAFRAFLRGLPNEIALAEERGLPVSFPAERVPHEAARRLLETLGVQIAEPDVSEESAIRLALELPQGWEPGAKPLTEAQRHHGRDLLEAMDRGERVAAPVAEEPPPPPAAHDGETANGALPRRTGATRGPRPKWNRENVIAAIRAFALEHGHPPAARDCARDSVLPDPRTAAKLCGGSWADVIEAAGFPRPRQGGWPRRRPIETPTPEQDRVHDERVRELAEETERDHLERIDGHARRERERVDDSAARAAERTVGTEKEPETPPRPVEPDLLSLEEAGALLLDGAAALFTAIAARLRA